MLDRNKPWVVILHFMLALCASCTFYEKVIWAVFYVIKMIWNKEFILLILTNWASLIFRSTMARLFLLFTGLGYYTITTEFEHYYPKIFLMAFLYAASQLIELAVVDYLAAEYQLLPHTVFLA